MLVALGSITATQAQGTDKTLRLLSYAATPPEATICYSARDMILHVQ